LADGHWTTKGVQIVAKRIYGELSTELTNAAPSRAANHRGAQGL
jgi:hypothetical protein